MLYYKQQHRIILVAILIILLIKAYFSEKILINHGFGWDGEIYADYTKNIANYLKTNAIDKYHFQRIGIPFILHHILSFFKVEFSNQNIITAFSCVNIFSILVACIYYFLISNFLHLKRTVEIIGFASLFFSFAILKFSLYYPVLMDTAAFTIGVLIVYYYLKQKTIICILLIFVGSFIYPTFILMSILLTLKKRNILISNTETVIAFSWLKIKFFSKNIYVSHFLFTITIPMALIYIMVYIYYEGSFTNIIKDFSYDPAKMTLIWSSFLLALLYAIYLNKFPKSAFSFLQIFKSISPIALLLSIGVYYLIQLVISTYAFKGDTYLTFTSYLYNIINQASRNPLNFIVAHVFYFGVGPILTLFILKDFKTTVLQYGYGMVAFFAAIVFFSLGNESRQLINYLPFMVLLMLDTLNRKWNVSLMFSVLYGLICIALSHFWFNINTNLTSETDYSKLEYFYEFPIQQYFMFQGPWVSNYMYKIHLIFFIIILVFTWLSFKKFNFIQKNNEDVLGPA